VDQRTPAQPIRWSDRLALIKRRTGSRTILRTLIGTAYLIAGVSAEIISSSDPGQDVRWGLRLFSFGLLLALVFTVLLVYRLRLDYLRLLLPWYGIPYQVWLIGSSPRHEGLGAAASDAWGSVGTVAFLVILATRP
jgi:hypothetical protein